MNILFIINPISGNKDKAELIKQVESRLTPADNLRNYKTTGENDVHEIRKKLEQNSIDRILVAGGDGTIKLVAEALGNKKISIGILPAGSANGLANDLDLPLTPEEFIPIALGNRTTAIDVLCINDQFGLHISDFGLNAHLIKEYDESDFRGLFGYAINSIPTLLQDKGPYTFTIETEEKTFKRTAIMLAIANSKKFGTGAVVNPNGKIDDGNFEVLIFKKLDFIEIIKTLREDNHLSADFVETISVKKVKITTEQPVDFQIDGEYCNALTSVEAHILPKRLSIAVS